MLKKWTQQPRFARRVIVMTCGIIIMGFGLALFKLTLMGNGPSTAMCLAISDVSGIDFALVMIAVNALFFCAEIALGRELLGVGTFINWFGVGPATSFFMHLFERLSFAPESFAVRLAMLPPVVLIVSLSCSMYQTANLGIAPYDSLSIIMSKRLPMRYFLCRMTTDIVSTLVTLIFGGIIGIGTVICSLGLGPFVSFFNRHVSEKLCGQPKQTL